MFSLAGVGNRDTETVVHVRDGKVTRIVHASPSDIRTGRTFFFRDGDLVGVYVTTLTRETFAGNGFPFHQGSREDLEIERFQFRDGRLATWIGSEGRPLPLDPIRFRQREEALRQEVGWLQKTVQYRDHWSCEALLPEDIDHPLLTAIFCGNASEARRILAGLGPGEGPAGLLDQACRAAVELGDPALLEALLERGAAGTYREGFGHVRTAAWFGHLAVLKVLLAHGARADVPDHFLFPIQYAARNGHLPVLQLLLEQKPLPQPLTYGLPLESSLLMEATAHDRLEVLGFLAARGFLASAPPDLPGKLVLKAAAKGSSRALAFLLEAPSRATASSPADLGEALWAAVSGNRATATQILLAHGADPDARNPQGKTPLMEACARASLVADPDYQPLVTLLLDAGADPGTADRQGKTVLEHAAGLNGSDLYQRLLRGSPAGNRAGLIRALGAAAEGGNLPSLETLLAQTPGLDLTREAAEPFRRCLAAGQVKVAAWFLRQGFDVRTASLSAPLAVVVGNLEHSWQWDHRQGLLDLLAAAGADPDALDASGVTALDHAWCIPFPWRKDCVDRLVTMGARHSFAQAAALGDVAGLETARRAGQPLDFRNRAGHTLLHLAAREGQPDSIGFLARLGLGVETPDREGKSPLRAALEAGQLAAAEALVRLGAQIDAQDRDGRTILFHLVTTASPAAIRFLLEHGADPNPRTKFPWDGPVISRLLCQPGFQARSEVAELLLQHGARLDASHGTVETMLHRAAEMGWHDDVRWLVDHGAPVNARDRDGKTPLGRALSRQQLEIADWLRAHGGVE